MTPPDRHDRPEATRPARGLRVLGLRLRGSARDYAVDLSGPDGSARPLSVIAGPTNTGKTSVLGFLDFCLGASAAPEHPEIVRKVRSATADAVGPDGRLSLERGVASSNVVLSERGGPGRLVPVGPAGDPESLSQRLLSTVGLDGVRLREAPVSGAGDTDPLSFRDLMWLCLYRNERLGPNALFENDRMKALKLGQVVDAVFGVHDAAEADLLRRVTNAAAERDAARRAYGELAAFVAEQQPRDADELERDREAADAALKAIADELAALDRRQAASTEFAADLGRRHAEAARTARRARAAERDRRSQIERFASLRAQYADDMRKLALLAETAAVFDQLSVTVCPACLTDLAEPPQVRDGRCGLCLTPLPEHPAASAPGGGEADASEAQDGVDAARDLVRAELRATRRRYRELTDFWQGLDAGLPALQAAADAATATEADAALALDRATSGAVAPYSAQREELLARRQAQALLRQQAEAGLRMRAGLAERAAAADIAERRLAELRQQRKTQAARPGRADVVAALSGRYADILRAIGYPKVDEPNVLPPFLDDRLRPHVRGQHYSGASSGGQVLVTLAWALAVFETAYEQGAAHPGFLLVDSPQKNLGGQDADEAFADIRIAERFYKHVLSWLDGAGRGAQVVVVDNTPPQVAAEHVVVRYTRDPATAPFGLIEDET